MPPAEAAAPGASSVLWLFNVVALIVVVLAAQLAFGYGREARLARQAPPDPRAFRRALAAGAAALGSGLWAAVVLVMASEPLDYAIGYRPLGLLLVWLGALLLGAAVIGPVVRQPSRLAVLGGGALCGIGVPGLQIALVSAAESDPGIDWGVPELLLAAMVATMGATVAMRIVFRGEGRHGRHRHPMRLAAAVLFGIAVAIAQSLTLAGAETMEQALELASDRTSRIVAATVAAVVVPAALVGGLIRLWTLRQARGLRWPAAPAAAAAGRRTTPSGS